MDIVEIYSNLKDFDAAHNSLKLSLDLCSQCYGNESAETEICHHQMASDGRHLPTTGC